MKKIWILLAAIIFLTASCGTSYKVFGIAPEEFMRRYNANLERVILNLRYNTNLERFIPDANLASRLKFKSATNREGVRSKEIKFISFETQQSYLAATISVKPGPETLRVNHRLDDEIVSHFVEFKLMAMVAAYSIDGSDDPDLRRWNDTAQVINNLFAQLDRGNFFPRVTYNGITYSLVMGLGDLGGKLKSESICFSATRAK